MIRFTKAKTAGRAGARGNPVLDRLRAFLAAAEPKAAEFLVSFWDSQARGISYAELREAYLAGDLTPQRYRQWTQAYSAFIQERLAPIWRQAADAGAAGVLARYPEFVYEPSMGAAMDYIRQRGAELVTNISEEQRKALRAVVAHISGYTAMTPDEAARIIRPTVGLTVGQTIANARYRESVKQAHLKAHPKGKPETAEKRAAEAAARYAARQHRYRAQNIARTELAFAYNAGAYGATRDAQAREYIGDCVKVWLTAYDERVCPVCEALDGERRGMDEAFSNGKLLPPAHPSCRCAVAYEEIPGTNLHPGGDDGIIRTEGTSQNTPGAESNMIINPAGNVVWIVDPSEVRLTGDPDTITQTVFGKGGITRNYYGHDGKRTKQISNNDHGNPKHHPFGKHGEHCHDYAWDENGKPIHGKPRELTDEERRENDDIL